MYHEMIEAWHIHRNDVDRVRALREPLRTVFEKAASDEKEAATILNEQLQISHAIPRISWQHGPLHIHFESAEEGCSQWLAATAVMGLTVMLCEYGGSRFGICASPSCRNVFLDTSKNKRKRYCSEACAHRESVAAFRARRRSNKLNKS
ncbi:CGNR zinc finger domain-containing protein [Bacillus sp. SD088]|nr:CGNR zinc finger domain-containing protein [Bacillus sp. SD088]